MKKGQKVQLDERCRGGNLLQTAQSGTEKSRRTQQHGLKRYKMNRNSKGSCQIKKKVGTALLCLAWKGKQAGSKRLRHAGSGCRGRLRQGEGDEKGLRAGFLPERLKGRGGKSGVDLDHTKN